MKNKLSLLIVITFAAFSCTQLNNPFLPSSPVVHNNQIIDRQTPETRGKEFYLAFTEQFIESSNPVNLSIFITGINATSGNVKINGLNSNISFNVAKDEIKQITIPYEAIVTSNDIIENSGIYINTDEPVTVTGLNHETYTTDSFLVYPFQSLGKEYYAMSYTSNDSIMTGSNFIIVATQDNTSISITPTITSGSRTAGTAYNISLNRYQTYRLAVLSGAADITGSHIISDKPIAVFSGNKIACIPKNIVAGDHLCEQAISVNYWIDSYIALPLSSRDRYTIRIMSSQNNTDIYINGTLNTIINAGEFYEQIMTETAVITSNKPVLTAQFAHGCYDDSASTGNGDPFMVILPGESQFLNNYLFTTMESSIKNNHINIVIFKDDKNNLNIDNLTVDPALFFDINEKYSGATISVSQGKHSIKSQKKFGIIIYGFDLYDSYGHIGG